MGNHFFRCKTRNRGGALLTTALLLLIFAPQGALHSTDGCSDCSRRAALDKFVNVHAPQYEKKLEEWNKCMQDQLGSYETFDPDDPKVKKAMANCAHLAPEITDYMNPSSVISKLAELLTGPCFRVVLAHGTSAPEYLFRGSFDAGLKGGRNARGQDIKSRFTLHLYYNGSPAELVKTWTTESPLTSVSSQYNRMFDNHDAELRREAPIENLLKDFECRPTTCQVDLGSNKEVTPGEEIEVKLRDFRDEQGRSSKYFNRVVVEAENGRIMGGSQLAADPDRRAFRIEEGTITFTYKAPDDCSVSEDRIMVHSSCSILDPGKDPMERTSIDKKITEKKIKIICPDLIAEYTSTFERERVEPEKNGKGKMTFVSKIRASYRLRRSSKENGEIEEHYDLISSTLESVSGQGTYSAQYVDNTGDEHIIKSQSSVSSGTIETGGTGLSVTYNAATGSVRKVDLDFFGVAFNVTGETKETIKRRNGRVRNRTEPVGLIPELIGAVSVFPEFESASGSRSGGVITGRGTHEFPTSQGVRQKLSLQYTLKKIKR